MVEVSEMKRDDSRHLFCSSSIIPSTSILKE